jgi:hypothetical protein
MFYRLTNTVEIGDYTFWAVHEVVTESSWDMMTDTCTIVIPKKLRWQGKPLVLADNPLLKKGNAVTIKLGYDDRNNAVFKGYITQIYADFPIQINCQDEMWKLKTGRFNKAYRSVKLSQLLRDMLTPLGVKYKIIADYDLGMLRTKDNPTPAKVLEELRKTYFLKFFFRNGTLYVGQAYVAELQTEHTVNFRDIPRGGNNLEYIRKEDVLIKLRCVILYPDNKKVEFEIGADDGEVRTFSQYDVPEKEMRRLAAIELERLRYEGYRGSLTLFGEPFVQHGDIVELIDDDNPERNGRYFVKKVSRKFSSAGYRQIIEPEGRVS